MSTLRSVQASHWCCCEEGGRLYMRARVANLLQGDVKYQDGRLSGVLMTTLMMPPPRLQEVESAIKQGFAKGMEASKDGALLTLSEGCHTLVFVLRE
uniref:DUF306 domain-containing protein n=1 Tax=Trypanosoma vivax (strain Y486) TaxID=1055687 RepID=G0TVI4_TRYVY|nr:conserved hypothetical protein [Trypanosoma vivax Y486]